MSTESEQPVQINCGTCGEVLTDGDSRLKCPIEECHHVTCLLCFRKMLAVMFGQPVLNYPLKCGGCQHAFDEEIFLELIIKENLYEKYIACLFPLFWTKDCLQDNEILLQCPFCPYFEIHSTDACSPQFFICQHPSCGQKSCLICLHAIENTTDGESHHRSHCHELRSYKQKIEQAIESGSQQHCPYCHLAGIKDDGCTHMVCQRCHRPWCYLCGMKESECSVGVNMEPGFASHNEDWHVNEGRCPMSLADIHYLDKRWPEDDQGCLEYFHRYRTLSQLFELLKIVGEEKFNEVNRYFGIIDGSGYSIEEIKDWPNQTFIDYSSEIIQ